MLLYNLVDLGHDADGLAEGDDDLLVVLDVLVGQHAAGAGVLAALGLTVLEPLLADLVAADVEVPHLLRHALEAASFILVDPDGLVGVGDLFDLRLVKAEGAYFMG